ncbi:helix-turn-helix domain-containing protein [Paenibacillus sp. BIC5C1]|uniref:helix-turn-helix transcriptional regulator n=1 Tax=Paenibacillus sp. BIC5C1 TaxID=3078263 RepID=UPI0028E9A223|nr:helix-turn-helix domain-containing protein [Paenibacillus sp. BIC5C1]
MDNPLVALEDAIRSMISEHVTIAENRLRAEFAGVSDKTLDVAETAAHIGISEKLIYRMCQEGSIPHERYGTSGSRRPVIKFRLSDLEAWRAAQRAASYKKES